MAKLPRFNKDAAQAAIKHIPEHRLRASGLTVGEVVAGLRYAFMYFRGDYESDALRDYFQNDGYSFSQQLGVMEDATRSTARFLTRTTSEQGPTTTYEITL